MRTDPQLVQVFVVILDFNPKYFEGFISTTLEH